MSRDGSGNYTLPAGVNPVVAGTTITDDWANTTLTDVATAMTDSLDRQGRGAPLANLSMGNFKLTSMAVGSAAADSIRYGQALNQDTVTIASAGTVDLVANLQTSVAVTGTTTITSFGTGAASGVRKFITFAGALTLTHSSTLICPGSTNIGIAAGDSIEVKSEGSNVWRVTNYQSGGGLSTRLSQLASATAANTLSNALFKQTWNWNGVGVLDASYMEFGWTNSGSTGNFITIQGNDGQSLFRVVNSNYSSELLKVGPHAIAIKGTTATSGGTVAGGAVSLRGGDGRGADSGDVTIYGGTSNNAAGDGGDVTIGAGSGAGSGAAGILFLYAADTAKAALRLDNTAITINGNTKLVLNQKHTFVDNTNGAPTITSGGGSGATIAGSDVAFEVVAGTGSPTSFTVTFANAWSTAPQIVLTSCSQAGCTLNYTATTTTVQISTDVAWSSGTKISVLCLGLQ